MSSPQTTSSDQLVMTCIDCGAPNPQWASVSLGTFFCLDCSGIHRSLGVHLSFVRSVSMDKWTEEQVGGNERARLYFKDCPQSIKERYSGEKATKYRDMILRESKSLLGQPINTEPPTALPPSSTSCPALNSRHSSPLSSRDTGSHNNSTFSSPPKTFSPYEFNNYAAQDSSSNGHLQTTLSTASFGFTSIADAIGDASKSFIHSADKLRQKITSSFIDPDSDFRQGIREYIYNGNQCIKTEASQQHSNKKNDQILEEKYVNNTSSSRTVKKTPKTSQSSNDWDSWD